MFIPTQLECVSLDVCVDTHVGNGSLEDQGTHDNGTCDLPVVIPEKKCKCVCVCLCIICEKGK